MAKSRGKRRTRRAVNLHRCTNAWSPTNHCHFLPQFEASGARRRAKLMIHILIRQKVIGHLLCIFQRLKCCVAVIIENCHDRLQMLFTNA
jgi:hypothetical protein